MARDAGNPMDAVDDLLTATKERIARERRLPESTYRLQFHAGFTFRDAAALVPYLHNLGITHCYASPYLMARPGSTHGYDVIDHCRLNPELGSRRDYDVWVEAMRRHGMSHILDTVPNHVGIATNDNKWWSDVLENGPASIYAGYFDITWRGSPRPELHDRVLLPLLGEAYAQVLEQGQLRLSYDAGAFALHYYERRFPIAPCSYDCILGHRLEDLRGALPADDPALAEYESILSAICHLPRRGETDTEKALERHREKGVIKRRLAALTASNSAVVRFIENNVAIFNGRPGDGYSFDLLDGLLGRQCYRLADWHVAPDEINYRRFFDINDLAALAMERQEVFEATHELILRLLAEGKLAGLRIDHPDGLHDPKQYFLRLQQHYVLECARRVASSDPRYREVPWDQLQPALLERLRANASLSGGDLPLYVVAEKILAVDEPLPEEWAVHGTSGYDPLNQINGLFVDGHNAEPFDRIYRECAGCDSSFEQIVYQNKRLILDISLASELHMLTYRLDRLAQRDRRSRDFTFNGLRHALRELIACFPVYRSYVSDEGVHESDVRHVETAVRDAAGRNPKISPRLFEFIRDMLLLRYPDSFTEADRRDQRAFAGKFQQVTPPVTAKGVEDTAFYVYNRLASLNEVGSDPGRFGVSPEDLHRYLCDRQCRWPYALSALSTHDTKRSEDVRARINVLSELPEEWRHCVGQWHEANAPHRIRVRDLLAPDANEEYLLYQTLIGAWPLDAQKAGQRDSFIERIQQYLRKALREAKVHTTWTEPWAEYEDAVTQFAARIVDERSGAVFLESFLPFQRRISHWGVLNSLSQTLLRLTIPGVPDTYQGSELWDLSLVDPDNRRPVDYHRRQRMLDDLQRATAEARGDARELARSLIEQHPEDGRAKLYVISKALHCRRENAGLFSSGEYLPIPIEGERSENLFCFIRRSGSRLALVAVPRLITELIPQGDPGDLPLGQAIWGQTRLLLPAFAAQAPWRNLFTGETIHVGNAGLPVGELLNSFPVALLIPARDHPPTPDPGCTQR